MLVLEEELPNARHFRPLLYIISAEAAEDLEKKSGTYLSGRSALLEGVAASLLSCFKCTQSCLDSAICQLVNKPSWPSQHLPLGTTRRHREVANCALAWAFQVDRSNHRCPEYL